MNIKKIFFITLIFLLFVGGAFIIVAFAENLSKNEECKKSYIMSNGECCIDIDSNKICDAEQFKVELDTNRNIEIIQTNYKIQELKNENDKLKNDNNKIMTAIEAKDREINYYSLMHNYEYILEEDDYWYYKKDINRYDLEIIAKDYETWDGLEDAYVRIKGKDQQSGYTNDNGRIRFMDIEEDCYDVRVEKHGYQTRYVNICVYNDEKQSVFMKN